LADPLKDPRRTPEILLGLGDAAMQMGAVRRAFELYHEVLESAAEGSAEAASAKRRMILSVPDWHARMMNDTRRNQAYDAAIRRAVTPGMRVLEIGTGAGLLAMMAARAGAARVITCEMNPAVAEVAREIVALNGFADRITVLNKHSRDVTLDDLGGPADLLVSEIVDNCILGEGVLPAHETAVKHLLKPDGQVIPARGTVRAALVDTLTAEASKLDHIEGFDVRPFRKFINQRNEISSGNRRTRLASEPVDLFRFDLRCREYTPPAETSAALRALGGPANAVAHWIALELDDVTRYENRPDADFRSCWQIPLVPLAAPIDLQAGQLFTVLASHDRARLTVWT
jgi:predicted RNA methylase